MMIQLTLKSFIVASTIVILYGNSFADGRCNSDKKPKTEESNVIQHFALDRAHSFNFDGDFARKFGGSYGPPKEITDSKLGSNQKEMAAIFKKINFEKKKVLIFRCHNISSNVKAKVSKAEGRAAKVVFTYHAGDTKDLISHIHVFVIPKEVDWEMAQKNQSVWCPNLQMQPTGCLFLSGITGN